MNKNELTNCMLQRNETISLAKAIGIILMVIGHSGCPALVYNFISLVSINFG